MSKPGRVITSQYIARFLRRGNYRRDLARDLYVREPRVLVDFSFDEVEFSVPERFERAFGRDAAIHWGLRPQPMSSASVLTALKGHYVGPILDQLNRNRPLLERL